MLYLLSILSYVKSYMLSLLLNKALTPIMKTAKRAATDKLLDFSVAEAICQLYLSDKKEMGDDEEGEVHYLTEEQMAEFVAMREKVKYPRTREFMDMFLFALNACGLRVSDIITLEWKSIDFEKRTLRKVLFKGDKLHEIPLNDDAIVDYLDFFEQRGIGIVNASPLSMGLLSQRGVPAWHPAPKALVEACQKAAQYCNEKNYPIEKLAVQFSVSNLRIASTLFSSANPENVKRNIEWANEEPDWDLVREVKEIIGDQQRVTWANS